MASRPRGHQSAPPRGARITRALRVAALLHRLTIHAASHGASAGRSDPICQLELDDGPPQRWQSIRFSPSESRSRVASRRSAQCSYGGAGRPAAAGRAAAQFVVRWAERENDRPLSAARCATAAQLGQTRTWTEAHSLCSPSLPRCRRCSSAGRPGGVFEQVGCRAGRDGAEAKPGKGRQSQAKPD